MRVDTEHLVGEGRLVCNVSRVSCGLTSHLLCAAKSRAIAIPVDLDSQVNNLFLKSHNIVQKTALNWRLSARNAARRDSVLAASRDYRNIIERLQVGRAPRGGRLAGGSGPHAAVRPKPENTRDWPRERPVGADRQMP